MAKTIRMTKNGMYADICDNPETIKNAQLEGWAFCKEESVDTVVEKAIEKELEPTVEKTATHKRASSSKK